ncbi:MAG: hypothetical protein ACK421_03700 [Pseudanabaenaceae cyanobacterium]
MRLQPITQLSQFTTPRSIQEALKLPATAKGMTNYGGQTETCANSGAVTVGSNNADRLVGTSGN